MKKRMVCGWFAAALAAWTLHAAAEQPRLTAIDVQSSPAQVTVRGTGTAGTAYTLAWTPTLGTSADWQPAGGATAAADGTFALLDGTLRTSCFYRVSAQDVSYRVVDLSGGPTAAVWPVSELDSEPEGGWTDEYKTTKLVLRRIPAGTYTMGSPPNETGRRTDEVRHAVTLTKAFYVGVFELTQKQWQLATGTTPSRYEGDTRPVENVSYETVIGTLLPLLTAKTGLDFDLPTEAQWEYACRAGTTTALNSGQDFSAAALSALARYDGNAEAPDGTLLRHAPVGSYLPNAWGLHDMHGNVAEWCRDWLGAYPETPVTDPAGPAEGDNRIIRGGSWDSLLYLCRSAARNAGPPDYSAATIGLRLVCSARPLHKWVQLWKDGPYWAETNIGADTPEDTGLYFWWGDTVGYKRENRAWVASDGSVANFSFTETNAPTYGKDAATLESEGWLKQHTYELAPGHDAAQAHWGGGWRMPTGAEIGGLVFAATSTWTTVNGVYGRLVTGLGDYASASIFLPVTGSGRSTNFYSAPLLPREYLDDESYGFYWSSSTGQPDTAATVQFYARDCDWNSASRDAGLPIRPVLGPVWGSQ